MGHRTMRGIVWLLAESETELAEVGLSVVSALYAIQIIRAPEVIGALVAYTTLRAYIDPYALAGWSLAAPLVALIAYVKRNYRGRRAAALLHFAFFFGVGCSIAQSAGAAPGLAFYIWSASVSLLAFVRMRHTGSR